jgi:citrate synthase
MADVDGLNAEEAARALGISVATLYSYVSRGLIRSDATGGTTRARRYNRDDVRRLRERQEERRNPAASAAHALNWGAPVLESALTLIVGGRLYYRGEDVIALAQTRTFEEVAALLWMGSLEANAPWERRPRPEAVPWRAPLAGARDLPVTAAFHVALALAAAGDPATYDLRPASVAAAGGRIVRLLAEVVTGRPLPEGLRIAPALQQGWAPGQPRAERLLEAALILCADHELNISAFTARCVASAGSPPHAVVGAGLSALEGARHGGHTARVEALLREVAAAGDGAASAVLAGRLRRGELIPGFGHPLYPEGDPRGRLLLDMTGAAFPGAAPVARVASLAQAARDLIGEYPTIDLALVVLAETLGLAPGSALALFSVGRSVGWIAHAIEHYETGQLIRPRARYTGPAPAVG